MKKFCMSPSVFLSVLLSMCFMISPLFAQNGVPLRKGKFVKILSMPEKVWENASIEITQGKEPNTLEAKLAGKISAVEGLLCFGCVKSVKIDPDLKVPMDPFFINIPVKGGPELLVRQVLTAEGQFYYVFIIPEGKKWAAEKIDSYLMSGPSGVILEKRLDNFILLDGSAEVFQ